ISRRWNKLSKVCALLALAIGGIGLAGWIFDIDALTRIHPSLVSMKFNTAVCLVVAAVSLLLLRQKNVSSGRRRLAQGGGIFIALVGAMTMAQHIWNIDLGIDQFIFHETPHRAGRS